MLGGVVKVLHSRRAVGLHGTLSLFNSSLVRSGPMRKKVNGMGGDNVADTRVFMWISLLLWEGRGAALVLRNETRPRTLVLYK